MAAVAPPTLSVLTLTLSTQRHPRPIFATSSYEEFQNPQQLRLSRFAAKSTKLLGRDLSLSKSASDVHSLSSSCHLYNVLHTFPICIGRISPVELAHARFFFHRRMRHGDSDPEARDGKWWCGQQCCKLPQLDG